VRVYLIGNIANGYCKVGKSEYPKLRVEALDRPNLPFDIEVLAEYNAQGEAHRVEKELHKFYQDRKTRGEWFQFIKPKDFLLKAKEFTGSKPKPGRITFNASGKIAEQKRFDQWLIKATETQKQEAYKIAEAFEEERRVTRAR
jgi:hypothetical protein